VTFCFGTCIIPFYFTWKSLQSNCMWSCIMSWLVQAPLSPRLMSKICLQRFVMCQGWYHNCKNCSLGVHVQGLTLRIWPDPQGSTTGFKNLSLWNASVNASWRQQHSKEKHKASLNNRAVKWSRTCTTVYNIICVTIRYWEEPFEGGTWNLSHKHSWN
jgi:hypothetical protein